MRPHPFLRSVGLSLLVCLPITLTSCTHGDRSGEDRRTRLPAKLRQPTPLPLPDDPVRLLHLETPQRYVDEFTTLGSSASLARDAVASMLTTWTGDETFARAIVASIDWTRPISAVELDQPETILSLPLRNEPTPDLDAALDALSRKGPFGARALATPDEAPAAPRLVWRSGDVLAMATSQRGLVTASTLRERYNSAPIRIIAGKLPGLAGVKELRATGDLETLEVRLQMEAMGDYLTRREAQGGAMTSLVHHEGVAIGGSFAWTGADAWIRSTAAEITNAIASQPFLIRGLVDKLGRRTNSLLRTWDGRCFVGISSRQGVMVGLGSRDPKKSGVAMLRLFGGVAEDLSLLGNFLDTVPSIYLKKNVGDAAGEPIHRLTVGKIRSKVPAELRSLLDDRGRLQLHFAFSRHTGAGMFVVGPEGLPTLREWLKETDKAPGHAAYNKDLVAVRTTVPIFALQGTTRDSMIDTFRALPSLPTARELTISADGDDALRILYRSGGTAAAAPVQAAQSPAGAAASAERPPNPTFHARTGGALVR